jgi:hypothetical protein
LTLTALTELTPHLHPRQDLLLKKIEDLEKHVAAQAAEIAKLKTKTTSTENRLKNADKSLQTIGIRGNYGKGAHGAQEFEVKRTHLPHSILDVPTPQYGASRWSRAPTKDLEALFQNESNMAKLEEALAAWDDKDGEITVAMHAVGDQYNPSTIGYLWLEEQVKRNTQNLVNLHSGRPLVDPVVTIPRLPLDHGGKHGFRQLMAWEAMERAKQDRTKPPRDHFFEILEQYKQMDSRKRDRTATKKSSAPRPGGPVPPQALDVLLPTEAEMADILESTKHLPEGEMAAARLRGWDEAVARQQREAEARAAVAEQIQASCPPHPSPPHFEFDGADMFNDNHDCGDFGFDATVFGSVIGNQGNSMQFHDPVLAQAFARDFAHMQPMASEAPAPVSAVVAETPTLVIVPAAEEVPASVRNPEPEPVPAVAPSIEAEVAVPKPAKRPDYKVRIKPLAKPIDVAPPSAPATTGMLFPTAVHQRHANGSITLNAPQRVTTSMRRPVPLPVTNDDDDAAADGDGDNSDGDDDVFPLGVCTPERVASTSRKPVPLRRNTDEDDGNDDLFPVQVAKQSASKKKKKAAPVVISLVDDCSPPVRRKMTSSTPAKKKKKKTPSSTVAKKKEKKRPVREPLANVGGDDDDDDDGGAFDGLLMVANAAAEADSVVVVGSPRREHTDDPSASPQKKKGGSGKLAKELARLNGWYFDSHPEPFVYGIPSARGSSRGAAPVWPGRFA